MFIVYFLLNKGEHITYYMYNYFVLGPYSVNI